MKFYIKYLLGFLLVIPHIGYGQIRYKSIEVADISEYGYQVEGCNIEDCNLISYLKITNISDSILIMRHTSFNIDFLYGGGSIFLPPGYSYLKPVNISASKYYNSDIRQYGYWYLDIYKVDSSTYYESNKDTILMSKTFERIGLSIERQSGLIRSVDPKSDTTQLKLNCPQAYSEFKQRRTKSKPDTSKIEIGGISEFGFYIQENAKRDIPIQIKINDTSYDNSANIKSLRGILTIENKSFNNIYVDKVVFDTPEGTIYYSKTEKIKDGKIIRKGKKRPEILYTSKVFNTYVNMNNYYIPVGFSAAYYFSYDCYFNDKNISNDDLLKRYNKLPGRVYFNDGTTMSFVLVFDKKHLLQQTKKVIWK